MTEKETKKALVEIVVAIDKMQKEGASELEASIAVLATNVAALKVGMFEIDARMEALEQEAAE